MPRTKTFAKRKRKGGPGGARDSVRRGTKASKECPEAHGTKTSLQNAMSSQSSQEISEISTAWRNRRIARSLYDGRSAATVAKDFKVSTSTVHRIKRRRITLGTTNPALIPGRPVSIKRKAARRKIEKLVKANPLTTTAALARKMRLSRPTTARILLELGYKSYSRRKRQYLTPANKEKRLEGANKILNLLKISSKIPQGFMIAPF